MSDVEIDALKQRVRDLEAAMMQNDVYLATAFRFTPTLNKIMGLLLSLPAVTSTMLVQRLNITADAKVAVHRLREHLKPWGICIHSNRSIGYWLDADTKAQVRGLVAKAERGSTPVASTPLEVAAGVPEDVEPVAA